MATNYPTSIDTLTNPTGTDSVATVDHAAQHADANDGIEALQTKVGADGSAVTTSHDYKLGNVTGSDKAASLTGTETLTNKTIDGASNTLDVQASTQLSGATPIANGGTGQTTQTEGFDALSPTTTTGDIIYHNGSDNVRLPAGANGETLQVVSGAPAWQSATSDPAASIDTISLEHLSNDSDNFDIYQDVYAKITANASTNLRTDITGKGSQTLDVTTVWADADDISGAVLIGDYMYLLLEDVGPSPDVRRVYRLDKDGLGNAAQITFSGQSLTNTDDNVRMTSDGTDFYFSHDSGNSANDYEIAKFTLSGTTLTYDSTITCGSTSGDFTDGIVVLSTGDILAYNRTTEVLKRYNSSGTLQSTGDAYARGSLSTGLLNWNDNLFISFEDTGNNQKRFIRIFKPE